MRRGAWSLLCGLFLLVAPAAAADIPLDDAGFTTYIQQKIQLYSPQPVRVTGPFAIAIGGETGVNLVYSFKPLHDDCVATPAQCPQKTHDFIQGIVGRFPAAAAEPPPPPVVPSDKTAFMHYLAAVLSAKLPGATLTADGMTLTVTRAGGRAIPFDETTYYTLCREAEFRCDAALDQALARVANWLTPVDRSGLRATLHAIAGCDPKGPCEVEAARAPMAPLIRKAFGDLEEVCFKPVPGDMAPLIDADRADLNLDADAAFALCEASTHAALSPLRLPPADRAGTVAFQALYAASYALFAADWRIVAAESGGHFVIAAPTRDLILLRRSDDAASIAALAAAARSFATGSLAISAGVYRWTGDGFAPAAP